MKKFILLLVIISGFIHAQEEYWLDEILIQAELDENAVETRKNTSFIKLVFTQKDINSFGHQTAGDVIKRVPGLYMHAPLNIQRNVKMAGLDKEFQTVLIDGVRPFGGGDRRDIKLDRIPVNMIEQIEVLKNAPSSFGSDAVTGIINIKLKKAANQELFNINLTGGGQTNADNLQYRINSNYANTFGSLSLAGGLSFHEYENQMQTEIRKFTALGKDIENQDASMTAFNFNLRYDYSANGSISFTPAVSYYDETTTIDIKNSLNNLLYETDNSIEDKIRLLQNYNLKLEEILFKETELEVQFNLSKNYEEKYKDRLTESVNELKFKEEDEEQRVTEYLAAIDLRSNQFLFNIKNYFEYGIKYLYNDRDVYRLVQQSVNEVPDPEKSDESYQIKEQQFSLYFQDRLALKDNLNMLAGLRFEYAHDDLESKELSGRKKFSSLNPYLNISYQPINDLYLKSTISKQISRPPFQYMAPVVKRKNRKTEMGNIELVPAKSWNIDLSVEKYFGKRNYIIISGFYKKVTDLIEQTFLGTDHSNNDNPIFLAVNISEAKVYGADLEIKTDLDFMMEYLSANTNISFLGSEIIDPSSGQTRRMKDQPEYIFNASLVYSNPYNGFDISLGLNHIGERIDPESSVGDLVQKPYTQVDLQIKYYFNNKINIFASGLNLLGEKGRYRLGPENRQEDLGSTFKLGINYNIL